MLRECWDLQPDPVLSELGRAGQRELARSGLDLAADIVICGAPEQDEPIEADILAAINPRLILVGNTAGFVNAAAESRLVSRLRKAGVPVFTTTRHGALSLSLSRGGVRTADHFRAPP